MSNLLYASRVLTENPIRHWPLEDGASFISLISEYDATFSGNWALTDCDVTPYVDADIPGKFPSLPRTTLSLSNTVGSVGASETISLDMPFLKTSEDIHSGCPVSVALYIYFPGSYATSVDIGSSSSNYDTSVIPTTVSRDWIKVESSSVDLADEKIWIRVNLTEGVVREEVSFILNGLSVGQDIEQFSSETVGVPVSKFGQYIKGSGLDVTNSSYPSAKNYANSFGGNVISVPIKMEMSSTTSNDVWVNDESLDFAKRLYANFNDTKKVILEPVVWISAEANPEGLNPSSVGDWFASWKRAIGLLLSNMPMPWGIYVGSKMDLIEGETEEWLDMMQYTKVLFGGNVLYKTSSWVTDVNTPSTITDYESDKRDLGLWGGVDFICISSFFELTDIDDPSQSVIESALLNTTMGTPDRAQNVVEEVLALYDTWGKPVILSDLSCPALNDGASQPWNPAVSGTPNTNIQDRLIGAYMAQFEGNTGYAGFITPYGGTTGVYELEANAVSRLSSVAVSPSNSYEIEYSTTNVLHSFKFEADFSVADVVSHTDGIQLSDDDIVSFSSSSLPSPIVSGSRYRIVQSTPTSFRLSLFQGGEPIDFIAGESEEAATLHRSTAFYVAKDKELVAKTTGIPMVYGTEHYTKLTSAGDGNPSFIFNGYGAFNMHRPEQNFTIEFWVRMNGFTRQDRKLFGPLEKNDGIYINGSVMTLWVNGKSSSAHIGNYTGPALINLRLHDSRADVMFNGDALITVPLDRSALDWSDKSNRMLGIFSYDDLGPVDISVPAVYSYIVPETVAKRRFVWGQGVPDVSLQSALSFGQSVSPSFTTSNIASSVSYPDKNRWGSGTYENLTVVGDKVALPETRLPSIVLDGSPIISNLGSAAIVGTSNLFTVSSHGLNNNDQVRFENVSGPSDLPEDTIFYARDVTTSTFKITQIKDGVSVKTVDADGTADVFKVFENRLYDSDELLRDLSFDQTDVTSFSLVPSEDWQSQKGYLLWESLARYIDNPKAVSITWSADTITGDENIIMLRSRSTREKYFRVYRDGSNVKTEVTFGSDTQVVSTESISANNFYTTMIDLSSSAYSDAPLSRAMRELFGNPSDIEVLAGGTVAESNPDRSRDTGITSMFWGKIKSVSFMNETTKDRLSDIFAGYPTQTIDYDSETDANKSLIDKATYSFVAVKRFDLVELDVRQVGYWEDYVPMSALAGIVDSWTGEKGAVVDFLQFNVGLPRPTETDASGDYPYYAFESLWEVEGATYEDFDTLYSSYQYSQLDSIYEAPSDGLTTFSVPYKMDDAEVRVFVSFQDSRKSLKSLDDLSFGTQTGDQNIVYFDAQDISLGESIEVIDGTTIVTPKNLNLGNLSLSMHVEFWSKGSIHRPLKVKSLEVASMAKSQNGFTDIGSRSGKKVFQFAENGLYYDHTVTNPYRIDKRGYPYLQLGRETGYVPTGIDNAAIDRGLAILIDEATSSISASYEIGLLQFWVKTDISLLPEIHKMYEFDDVENKIVLNLHRSTSGKDSGTLIAVDGDGSEITTIGFYQNGVRVSNPVLSSSEWTSITLQFADPLVTSSNSPTTKIYPGAVYNNISYFQPDQNVVVQTVPRPWQAVSTEVWSYWSDSDPAYSWYEVLYPQAEAVGSAWGQKVNGRYFGAYEGGFLSYNPLTVSQDEVDALSISSSVTYTSKPV